LSLLLLLFLLVFLGVCLRAALCYFSHGCFALHCDGTLQESRNILGIVRDLHGARIILTIFHAPAIHGAGHEQDEYDSRESHHVKQLTCKRVFDDTPDW